MHVAVEMLRQTELHGGAVIRELASRATLPLGLAVHLVRNGMAWPADDDATDWILIGIWLQDAIPTPQCGGTRARRRAGRERAALTKAPPVSKPLAMA